MITYCWGSYQESCSSRKYARASVGRGGPAVLDHRLKKTVVCKPEQHHNIILQSFGNFSTLFFFNFSILNHSWMFLILFLHWFIHPAIYLTFYCLWLCPENAKATEKPIFSCHLREVSNKKKRKNIREKKTETM